MTEIGHALRNCADQTGSPVPASSSAVNAGSGGDCGFAAGGEDGIILDNGGSVACWASWLHPHGGFLFAAPDYRPPGTSIIALVLRGPVLTELPGGSVAYAVL